MRMIVTMMLKTAAHGSQPTRPARVHGLALGLVATLAMAGCSSTTSATPGTLSVIASAYPLAFAAERVGGEHVSVTSLTAPGAEPHDLEVTATQAGQMASADAVFWVNGFQPSVDEAATATHLEHGYELSAAAALVETGGGGHDHDAHDHATDAAETAGDETGDEHAEGDGHDHSGPDPHFWLDPERYGHVATAMADALAERDPSHAESYRANARAFVTELNALDADFSAGLRSCRSRLLVTSHEAFGYLAARYDLDQHGISGISPDAEPSPAALAEITTLVRTEKVGTVFQETLVPAQLAKTIATETGAKLDTLDPVEGVTNESKGRDYVQIMRANLQALRTGLECA